MSAPGNIFNLPTYIKARSPDGLRALMLENNAKRGTEFQYYQIVFADGYWFAWFYDVSKEYQATFKKVK